MTEDESSPSSSSSRFDAAVTAMTLAENRFDVTIICTTDDYQAEFWMSQLDTPKTTTTTTDHDDSDASCSNLFPMVLAVSEDWEGGSGAGNGLGTLYAWTKACAYAKRHKNNVDLEALLKEGKISASLYHTAGKGTRMAPLPASENNNKPGVVRIPSCGCRGVGWDFVIRHVSHPYMLYRNFPLSVPPPVRRP